MTAPTVPGSSTPDASQIRVQALLGVLSTLLLRDENEPIEAAIQSLVKHFDATAAGLCSADEGAAPLRLQVCGQSDVAPPMRFPWEENTALLQRLCGSGRAQSFENANGSWLACQVWEPRFGEPLLAWLWHVGRHTWSAEEAAALPLAGQMLARCLIQEGGIEGGAALAWQVACARRHLTQAAAITSRLSHDVGNVLTGILGFAQLAQQVMPTHASARAFLQEVVESAQRGAAWVHKLHLFCRRTSQPVWPTVLTALLPEQQERVQARGKDGLTLHFDASDELPLLGADAATVRHLLSQLIDNACEAMLGPGTVSVTARAVELDNAACRELFGEARPGSYVEVVVRDPGRGISAEVRARLFTDVFFSTKPSNRGLGLLTSFGLLKRYGGGLRLDAPADGPGTLARVYLPVLVVPTDVAPAARGAHVLLVMDDAPTRASARRLLETLGATVAVSEGAHPAMAQYQASSRRFDLVLAEVRLAHLTGFELARRLLDRDPTANFVFVQIDDPIPAPCGDDRLKRFAHLTGPLDPPPVLAAVQTALAKPSGTPSAT